MFGWDDVINTGLKLLDKVIPDPAAKAAAQLELLRLQQAGELKYLEADMMAAKGQTDINAVEAASNSLFVAGWRPFSGLVCGVSFAAKYVGGPLAFVVALYVGHPFNLPPMEFGELLPILLGMLGLGVMRSYEKVKGV